ncbi:MAG: acyl-CoA/acyl-ACP dehydrogenase [Deltaproteobacteria bacterium]|nr:acyl-CoA/acyl-ACP dehydrogenase [Deltaproteobacteria bacterium]
MRYRNPFLKNITASPAETHVRRLVRNWADRVVIPQRRLFDEDWKEHEIIEPAIKSLIADMGFQKALFPAEFGGWNLGQSDSPATFAGWLLEEVSRADSGICMSLVLCFWPLVMITVKPHINRRLCAEFAPLFKSDKPRFAAIAMTEPQGGCDIENIGLLRGRTIRTTALRDGDEWVITGHKLWPSNTGGTADLFGVVCTTNPGSDDDRDIAYIYVPADLPGVTQGAPYEKAGMAADRNSDIWFEDVRVPLWYRAWGPGLDALYFKEVMAFGGLASQVCTGVMINVYEILNDFCSRKTLRGVPLKEHDAVAAELSEIVTALETCRAAAFHLASVLDRPDRHGPRWSDEIIARSRACKMFVADTCLRECERAMEILSAYGADSEWDIEKHWRDLKIVQLFEGGKQLCQMETARYYFDCKTL